MKKALLWVSFAFGLFIAISAIRLMQANPTGDPLNSIGVTAILIVFGFYPFNFLLLTQNKQGIASTLEKVLQWPFFGRKNEVPINLGPWWANRLENGILLTSFLPFLLILLFVWLAKLIRNFF